MLQFIGGVGVGGIVPATKRDIIGIMGKYHDDKLRMKSFITEIQAEIDMCDPNHSAEIEGIARKIIKCIQIIRSNGGSNSGPETDAIAA